MKKFLKKIWRLAIDNYFISIFFACIAFVGLVSIYKLFFVKPTYVYAKVKISQGLWWASTQKPSPWFIEALKKEKEEKDLIGNPIAKILSVRYYPWWGSGQYDIYLTLKLKVSGNPKTGKYNFKRSAIGVGAPIDFEFPQVQFSGTVIELSKKPFKEKYQEKIVYLYKPFAYPFEYESIKIGDSYFDGQEKTVEILDKQLGEASSILSPYKSIIPFQSQTRQNILVKLKLKVKEQNNQLIFGEEQVIAAGKTINISTDNFQFNDYVVAQIE